MIDIDRLNSYFKANGYTLNPRYEGRDEITEGTLKWTDRWGSEHKMTLMAGASGCACLVKPNLTTKWYYDKSNAQLIRILDQVKEFYR